MTKSKPAGGAIDINKLRGYVNKHSEMLQKRAALNGEIRALLNQADDAGFDKKAIEDVSKRKNKNRDAAIAHGHLVEEYEVALGLATADMFYGNQEPDAAAEAKAEAAGDPAPEAPSPAVTAPKAKRAKRAKKAKKATSAGATAAEPDPNDPTPENAPADEAQPPVTAGAPEQPTPPVAAEFAYEAGKRAAKAGWAETRNPYKQDETSKAQWAAGFRDGLDEDGVDAPRVLPSDNQESERAPA